MRQPGAIGAAVSAGVLETLGPQWIAPLAAAASLVATVVISLLAHRLRRRTRTEESLVEHIPDGVP